MKDCIKYRHSLCVVTHWSLTVVGNATRLSINLEVDKEVEAVAGF